MQEQAVCLSFVPLQALRTARTKRNISKLVFCSVGSPGFLDSFCIIHSCGQPTRHPPSRTIDSPHTPPYRILERSECQTGQRLYFVAPSFSFFLES